MRTARQRVEGAGWYHVYDRVAGWAGDRPLTRRERLKFWEILEEVAGLMCLKVIAAVPMGNHYHLLVWQPGELPSEEETCRRYERYYRGRRRLVAGTVECQTWRRRLVDLSWMMRLLKQRMAMGFNRRSGRRGPMWADRFRTTVLEGAGAVWRCWKYVEGNPVRAGLVRRAQEYGEGTLGRWVRAGEHVWGREIEGVVIRELGELLGVGSLEELKGRLLAEVGVGEEVEGRYWVMGRVVGVWERVVRWTGRAMELEGDGGGGLWVGHVPRAWVM